MAGEEAASAPQETVASGAKPKFRAPQAKFSPQDFIFGRMLGLGSFSKVARATLKATGEEFALKVMDKRHIMKENKALHVKQERMIIDSLEHPGIVRLCFTFQDEYSLYMGLELCPGGELFDQIKRRGRIPLEDAQFYAAEIVDILEYIHKEGVVHRDLKPENLLLTAEGHLKLADFGSAKLAGATAAQPDSDESRRNSFVGTAEYVSPELLSSKPVTAGTDLWALGCILYQMLEGRPPFKAPSEYLCFQKVLKRDFDMPSHFAPQTQDLINKLLVLEAEQRLGAGPGSYAALKAHPFFSSINWATLWTSPAPAVVGPGPNLEYNSDGEELDDDDDDPEWDLAHIGGMLSSMKLPSGASALLSPLPGTERGQGGAGSGEAEVTGSRSKLLDAADINVWQAVVDPKERLLACSLVKKTRGLSVKKRQLLLTDGPRLLYMDPVKMIVKGEIPWSSVSSVRVESPCSFNIHTAGRVYILEDQRGLAWQWKEAIDNLLSK